MNAINHRSNPAAVRIKTKVLAEASRLKGLDQIEGLDLAPSKDSVEVRDLKVQRESILGRVDSEHISGKAEFGNDGTVKNLESSVRDGTGTKQFRVTSQAGGNKIYSINDGLTQTTVQEASNGTLTMFSNDVVPTETTTPAEAEKNSPTESPKPSFLDMLKQGTSEAFGDLADQFLNEVKDAEGSTSGWRKAQDRWRDQERKFEDRMQRQERGFEDRWNGWGDSEITKTKRRAEDQMKQWEREGEDATRELGRQVAQALDAFGLDSDDLRSLFR